MQKLIYGLLGVLAVGFLWLCGNAISSNLAYDNWIKGLDTNKYIAADSRNGDMGDNYEGNKDAKVIISEYADYQCPFCSTVFPYLSDIVKEYDGQVGLVFRSYILSYHQNGTAAASAANAAALQGQWEPYAKRLFQEQSNWESLSVSDCDKHFREYFVEVTEGKGDTEKFLKDMNSDAVKQKIKADMAISKRLGVNETPTIYINGKAFELPSAKEKEFKEKLREVINQALKSQFRHILVV